jgi:hypothetical protein
MASVGMEGGIGCSGFWTAWWEDEVRFFSFSWLSQRLGLVL